MNATETGPSRRPRSGAPLPHDLQAALRATVSRLGESKACELIGLSRATFARALAGLGVQPGTVAMIRATLEAKP